MLISLNFFITSSILAGDFDYIKEVLAINQARSDAVPLNGFDFERNSLIGSSEKYLLRTIGLDPGNSPTRLCEDADAGIALHYKTMEALYETLETLHNRSKRKKNQEDNPYQPLYIFRIGQDNLETLLGAASVSSQPIFETSSGKPYDASEHKNLIDCFVKIGVRTTNHKEILDDKARSLGLLKMCVILTKKTTDEDIIAIIESLYNLAEFIKSKGFLLPPELDSTQKQKHRAIPDQMFLSVAANGRLDTLLDKYKRYLGYDRHTELSESDIKYVAYTKKITSEFGAIPEPEEKDTIHKRRRTDSSMSTTSAVEN